MKRFFPLLPGPALGALLLLILGASTSIAQNSGSATLPGLDGGSLTEAELLDGDATIVIFWASWSPRCRDVIERSNTIAAQWQGRARVVTVNFQERVPEIRAFLEGQTVRVPVYRDPDGRFAKKHSVTTLPSMLIYRQGRIAFEGALPADPRRVISGVLDPR